MYNTKVQSGAREQLHEGFVYSIIVSDFNDFLVFVEGGTPKVGFLHAPFRETSKPNMKYPIAFLLRNDLVFQTLSILPTFTSIINRRFTFSNIVF
jgi:hypothetical protein